MVDTFLIYISYKSRFPFQFSDPRLSDTAVIIAVDSKTACVRSCVTVTKLCKFCLRMVLMCRGGNRT